MPTEGMVDALRRARELVRAGGFVLDLHPTAELARVLVGEVVAGPVDAPDASRRHQAATDALGTAVRRHLFREDGVSEFEFSTYADSIDELQAHITEDWRNARIGDDTMARAQALLRAAPGAPVRVRERVRIARLTPCADC